MTPRSDPSEGRGPVPTNAEEALEIARTQFAPRWPDGSPAPLKVREFDIGYLVYATFSQPAPRQPTDRPRPAANPGGTCVVVSKENGEISPLPHRPPEAAIALYRKVYRPDTL